MRAKGYRDLKPLTPGYFGDPERTAETFDADGTALCVGDVGDRADALDVDRQPAGRQRVAAPATHQHTLW